jgi:dihydroorotate dehydrogenase
MAGLYKITRPFLFALTPEASHGLTIKALKWGLGRFLPAAPDPEVLSTSVWGLHFSNPVGVAAGFDKNAEVPAALLRLGTGFAEIGTVTPLPQDGNPKPRLFRLTADQAVINRLGFNNNGLVALAAKLERIERPRPGPVGVNIGANKDSPEPIADYVTAIRRLANLADYFVINVSSPNTPGLRDLQTDSTLRQLAASAKAALVEERSGPANASPPILVKVAPDLDENGREQIARVALEVGIDGLVVTNTTLMRPQELNSANSGEAGGLSGAPLLDLSTQVLSDLYRLTKGRIPLIGVGGISTGQEAYRKIRAGASLVQLYTALIFEGPGLIGRIKDELAALLSADGFGSVAEAVGADHKSRQ